MSDQQEETGMALVASILSGIQASQLKTERQIGALHGTQGQILQEVRKTNGRVTELETWRDGLQDETEQAAAYHRGIESRKEQERAVIARVWGKVGKYVITAFVAVLAGAGARIGAWFIGDSWVPW